MKNYWKKFDIFYQTKTRQVIAEHIKSILFMNKLLEMQLEAEEFYQTFQPIAEM